jgi:hypothetical protein
MPSTSKIWLLGLGLVGCDQIMQYIPGQAPPVAADTGGVEGAAGVEGIVEVAAPPATAQENDDEPVRDNGTLDDLTRLSVELAEALERYIGWEDPVEPFEDTLSGHEVPPFTVEVIDLQLIHPWMTAYRVHQTFTYSHSDLRRNEGHWGAAVTVEVRNDTGRVLDAPDFELGLKLNHGYQNSVCAIDTELDDDDATKTASLQQSTDRPWDDETSGAEQFWRPGEVVRRQLVTMCGDATVFDAGIGSGVVQVNIEADEYLGSLEHEMVGAVQQHFGADAFTLRKVALGKKRVGYAYGSGVITFDEGRIRRLLLPDYRLRPDSPDVFTPIPGVMAPVVATMNELTVTVDSMEVKHWSDVTKQTFPKGTRRVTIRLKQSIDTEAILERLNSAIAQAKAARKQARQSMNAAEAALDRVRAGGNRTALAQANRAFADSKRNFDSAKRMVKVAKDTYETGVARERERMGRALSCERVRLVTPTREVSVTNSDSVRKNCSVLREEDEAATTLRYTISRYEVPVGVSFDLGEKAWMGWVANQVTTDFDAR